MPALPNVGLTATGTKLSNEAYDLAARRIQLGRSVVRSFVRAFAGSSSTFFGDVKIFRQKNWGRRDRFRPRIVEIGAILAIFELFEVPKFA